MVPEIDTSQLPVIVTRYREAPSDEELASYLAQMTQLIREVAPHVQIVIVEGQHRMSPRQREMQAQWIREHAELLRAHGRGIAYVFESPLQRLILRSMLLLQRMPMPYKICASFTEARAWVGALLDSPTTAGEV